MIQLSIIIPVTNMHGRLNHFRISVTKALELGAQVVVIHDHRDDATSAELHQFKNQVQSGNLILVEDKFGNPGSARNAGIQLSQRKYLAFWDADDQPNVDLFIDFFKDVEMNQSDLGIAEYSVSDRHKRIQHRSLTGDSLELCWEEIAFQPGLWRMIFKAELSRKIKFPALRMGEDQIFLALFLNHAQTSCVSHLNVYTYFTDVDGQLTRDKIAISDLNQSLDRLKEIIGRSNNSWRKKLIEVMYLRMILSSRKIGVWGFFRRLIMVLRRHPKLFARLILMRMFKIASVRVIQK